MKRDKGLLRLAPDTATGYRVTDESYVEWFAGSKELGWRLLSSTAPSINMINTSKPVIEIKKPRTKTEFVKSSMNLFEIIDFLESGKKLYTNDVGSTHICQSIYKEWKLKDLLNRDFYIEVETEIDERQDFIDTAVELLNKNSHDHEANHYKEWFGAMFDSGKFKLVE